MHDAIERIRYWHDGARWATRRFSWVVGGRQYVTEDTTLDQAIAMIDAREQDCVSTAQSLALRKAEEVGAITHQVGDATCR